MIIDIKTCCRLGWLYGKLAKKAKVTSGAYGTDMQLPIDGCLRLHNQLAKEGKLSKFLIEACREIIGNLPAEYGPGDQADLEGQSSFALWKLKSEAGSNAPDTEEYSSEIGLELKAARKAAGLTQVEAAKAAGLTQAALSRIESSYAHPRKSTAKKLREIYESK